MNNKLSIPSAVLLILFSIIGCVSYVKTLDENHFKQKIPFIEDGKTTKEEVLQEYGEAAKTYKNGSILIYYMDRDIKDVKSDKLIKDKYGKYHLVLVINPDGVVIRHSLVEQ